MLGIITKDLSCSQLNYNIFNQLSNMNSGLNGTLFYKNLSINFFPMKFPIMNYSKIFSGYLGKESILIATDLDSAITLSKVKNAAKKLFYVWELEFLKTRMYERDCEIYNSLPVITRSESYKQALDNYANTNAIVAEFNLENLWTANIY